MPIRPDSPLGRAVLASRSRPPLIRITLPPRLARFLVAAGARPAPVDDSMSVEFKPGQGQPDPTPGQDPGSGTQEMPPGSFETSSVDRSYPEEADEHSAPGDSSPSGRTRSPARGTRIPPENRLESADQEILSLLASGNTIQGIATLLGVSPRGVREWVDAIVDKLDDPETDARVEIVNTGEIAGSGRIPGSPWTPRAAPDPLAKGRVRDALRDSQDRIRIARPSKRAAADADADE
jgi:hypothetical protein